RLRSGCPLCLTSEELKHSVPPLRTINRVAHDVRAGAVPFEIPVLEINAREAAGFWRKRYFHFARFRHIGLVLPVWSDLPCDHESTRWVPDKDAAPVALRVID